MKGGRLRLPTWWAILLIILLQVNYSATSPIVKPRYQNSTRLRAKGLVPREKDSFAGTAANKRISLYADVQHKRSAQADVLLTPSHPSKTSVQSFLASETQQAVRSSMPRSNEIGILPRQADPASTEINMSVLLTNVTTSVSASASVSTASEVQPSVDPSTNVASEDSSSKALATQSLSDSSSTSPNVAAQSSSSTTGTSTASSTSLSVSTTTTLTAASVSPSTASIATPSVSLSTVTNLETSKISSSSATSLATPSLSSSLSSTSSVATASQPSKSSSTSVVVSSASIKSNSVNLKTSSSSTSLSDNTSSVGLTDPTDGTTQVSTTTTNTGVFATSVTLTSSNSSSVVTTGSETQTSSSSATNLDITSPLSTLSNSTTKYTGHQSSTLLVVSTTSLNVTTPKAIESTLRSLSTSQVQKPSSLLHANNSGSAHTSSKTTGVSSVLPIQSGSVKSSASFTLLNTSTSSGGPTATTNATALTVVDIFQAIATNAPPPQIRSRSDHPVPRLGIQPQQQTLETNKFYANFFLGDQSHASWTHPYSVAWSKGAGLAHSWGLAVSHVERHQLTSSPKTNADAGAWGSFANPTGIQSIILSASELQNQTQLTTDSLQAFSANVNLLSSAATTPIIKFPLVQGMGFVTGMYNDGTPLIQSGVGFDNVTYSGTVSNGNVHKYRAHLHDGHTWLIYVTPQNSSYQVNKFTLLGPSAMKGPSGFSGNIQVAKLPMGGSDAESIYDASAGTYVTGCAISGHVQGKTGSYSLSFTTQGPPSQSLMMFALPHHVESFSNSTAAGITDVKLMTTTKGWATLIRGETWSFVEPDLPTGMSFAPWSPVPGTMAAMSSETSDVMGTVGEAELAQGMMNQTNGGSLYYDGKSLAKFAAMVYALHDLADKQSTALAGLQQLKQAYAVHVNNSMQSSLVYDNQWGGIVSLSTYLNGNPSQDFGNTYYSDHHFHYGYFVYTAAVIGYLDPAWSRQSRNKEWVNTLVRDYANSITTDSYFPFSRMFDWYHGHSWAEGLFASADGKNQESSSEDSLSLYAIKMWGKVTNDSAMEARGNLMLALQARSLSHYFLYLKNNTAEPAAFTGNKVSGILFENKIEHKTYFGDDVAYIEGIHMLPLLPFSTYTRPKDFVRQEAQAYNLTARARRAQGGWRGLLMANLATLDPHTSYKFFSNASGEFNYGYLDSGASQTWYLAWCAALGGRA